MKKILFSLVALVAAMSMNAQVMKVYKDGQVVAKFNDAQMDSVVYANPTVITFGSATATIDGNEVDVNWVQLWEDGPKFAEFNVGAACAANQGTTMSFTNAKKVGTDYVWGANWRTPSMAEMDELVKAATSALSEKVTCEFTSVNGVYGFKFTGKEDGYTDNSIFLPALFLYNNDNGYADYWSSTVGSGNYYGMYMDLNYQYGLYQSSWNQEFEGYTYLVRPVLVEE